MSPQSSPSDTACSLPYHSILFTLPLEIRGHIYNMVFQNNISKLPLLQTNQQILLEARAQLYSQPARFDSQDTFYAWLSRSQPDHLARVKTLSLTIADLDLSNLIGSHGERLSLWDTYTEELRKLNDAFSRLPNLLNLTIKETGTSRSFLFEDFFRRVLKLLQDRFPNSQPKDSLSETPSISTTNDEESPQDVERKAQSAEPGTTKLFGKDSLSPEGNPKQVYPTRWHSDPSGLCKHISKQQHYALGRFI